jgi:hypothetical protein
MGAANQNTARSEPGEGCSPKVFGGTVTRTIGPRPWGRWRDARAANTKEDEGVNASEVLVTGGTGSLGRQVVDRLRGPGYEVRTLSRIAHGAGVANHAGKYGRVWVRRGR